VAELLAAAGPDAASVCVPGPAHRAVAVDLLAAGVPVLVEKPLAATAADAAAIVAAAERAGVLCQPGHILRHSAPHRALHDAVRAGRIGDVLAVSSRRDRPRTLSRLFPREHPALLTAVHDIDLALWYAGAPVVEVRAAARTRPGSATPVLVWAELRHANDVVSSIRNSYLLPEHTPNHTSDLVEVYGTDGVAHVDLGHPTLLVQGEPTEAPDWLLSPVDGGGALAAELRHFLGRIDGTEPTAVVPLADGLHVVRVAEAVVDSASAGGSARRVPQSPHL
jgi:predicted dehydrogenase